MEKDTLHRAADAEYSLPEVGDIVCDETHNELFGDGRVRVTEVLPNAQARTHYVECDTGERSVAYYNPSYDERAPVVKGQYVNGSSKTYAFSAPRLK